MRVYSVLGLSDVDDSVAGQLGVFSSLEAAQAFVSALPFEVAVDYGVYEATQFELDGGGFGEVVFLDPPEFD